MALEVTDGEKEEVLRFEGSLSGQTEPGQKAGPGRAPALAGSGGGREQFWEHKRPAHPINHGAPHLIGSNAAIVAVLVCFYLALFYSGFYFVWYRCCCL